MVFALAGCAANSNSDEASSANAEYATKLFGEDVITINITTSEEDWDYLIENATSKPYISADVEIDGVTYDDVGIKTKGNTSLTQVANSDSDRYSLKINFDKYVDGQNCYGLDSLALNNLYSDNSYLKEYMQFAYWLINPYYEEIYGRVGNVSTLNDLRADFLSNDFWLYVLDKLYDVINTGWDYLFIDQEFFSVVRGLFSCDLPTNTKPTLAKVNAALSQIKSFR